MKKFTLAFLLLGAFASKAQEVKKDSVKVDKIDELKQNLDVHSDRFNAMDERVSEMNSDVSSLKKIKISGYIQAQYETYDFWSKDGTQHGVNMAPPGQTANFVDNTFYLRRARFKITYEGVEGVKFVLQPNFDIDKVQLKDAYVQLNDRWTKTFSLTMGQFCRTTYEIEYSSASREFAERSLMSRTLYPNERDQGAKLEGNFATKYNIPLRLQACILNGNFGQGANTTVNGGGYPNQLSYQLKDVDNNKDFMGRLTYSVKLPKSGLGIDFGAHTYQGSNTVLVGSTTAAPINISDVNGNLHAAKAGERLAKQIYGGEAQVYWDFLGGLSLKTEYMRGTYSGLANSPQAAANTPVFNNVNKVRNIEGAYVSLVKNIGAKHQLGARWDMFDPNTKLGGNAIKTADDLKYNNYSYAYSYFFDDNIKIQLTYNQQINEKSTGITSGDFANHVKTQNTFTVRLQARF